MMELELVDDREGFLLSFRDERQLDLQGELSPASLCDLEGSFIDVCDLDTDGHVSTISKGEEGNAWEDNPTGERETEEMKD